MTPIKVKVLKPAIANAIKQNSHRCMIADTLQKQIPKAQYISVDTQSIRFTDKKTGLRHIYLTPPRAQLALLKFDKGESVNPFAFTMSQGYSRKMRVLTGKIQRHKKYKRTDKRYMPKIQREFGLRKITAGNE